MSDAATGPQISNELTDDQRAKLTFQMRDKYIIAMDAKKAADNKLKQLGKEIKSDLGSGGLQDIKDMIKLTEPEGEEELREAMERRARVMRWLAMPVGTTVDMFPKEDRRPITERAHAEGKRAGLAAEPHKNPYHQTNDGHKAWNDGYVAGQAVVMTGFGKLETDGKAVDSLAGAKPQGKA